MRVADMQALGSERRRAIEIVKLLRCASLHTVAQLHAAGLQKRFFMVGEEPLLTAAHGEFSLLCADEINVSVLTGNLLRRTGDRHLVNRGRNFADIGLQKHRREHLREFGDGSLRFSAGSHELIESAAEYAPELNRLRRKRRLHTRLRLTRLSFKHGGNAESGKEIEKQRGSVLYVGDRSARRGKRLQRTDHARPNIVQFTELLHILLREGRAVATRVHGPRLVARKRLSAKIPFRYIIFKQTDLVRRNAGVARLDIRDHVRSAEASLRNGERGKDQLDQRLLRYFLS